MGTQGAEGSPRASYRWTPSRLHLVRLTRRPPLARLVLVLMPAHVAFVLVVSFVKQGQRGEATLLGMPARRRGGRCGSLLVAKKAPPLAHCAVEQP